MLFCKKERQTLNKYEKPPDPNGETEEGHKVQMQIFKCLEINFTLCSQRRAGGGGGGGRGAALDKHMRRKFQVNLGPVVFKLPLLL